MIFCEGYSTDSGLISPISPENISSLLAPDSGMLIWIDLEQPTDAELTWLQTTFGFHHLAMEDVRKQNQRPKLDDYDQYHFFVLQSLKYQPENQKVEAQEIDLFVGSHYVVSVHQHAIPAIDHARQRWQRGHFPKDATSYLFYLICDAIVDSYFPIVDDVGELIDSLDERIFAEPETETLRRAFDLRKTLLTIRKTLGPLRDAFNELIRSGEVGTIFPVEHTRAYYSDVYDHILRLTDFVDTYRDMLSGSLDAYQSAMSNRINQNMQRLTVAATILATATVITGFFGMNLNGMLINSRWMYGGHAILAALLILTAFEIWIFRRKGWM